MIDDKHCFDLIRACGVIKHIVEDEKVLVNLTLAIVSGDALLITVPQHSWLRSTTDDFACYVRRFTHDDHILKVIHASREHASFFSLMLTLLWLSQLMTKKAVVDLISEFKIPRGLNAGLEGVMNLELLLLRVGVSLPVGGSHILAARKH